MLVFVADFSCLLYNVYDVNSGAKWGSWSGRDQRRQGRQRIAGSKGWSGILFQIYLQKRVVFMKMIINDVTFFFREILENQVYLETKGRKERRWRQWILIAFIPQVVSLLCLGSKGFFFFLPPSPGFQGFSWTQWESRSEWRKGANSVKTRLNQNSI